MKVCFIVFSESAASASYVARKRQKAEDLGVGSSILRESATTTAGALAVVEGAVVAGFNGIVVQLPLPEGVDARAVINAVPQELDIDLLGEASKVFYKEGKTNRMPPVAYAVKTLLKNQNIELADKQIVLLGMGKLVGEPVAMWLDREGYQYSKIDKHTPEEEKLILLKTADIIISGIGVPHYVKPEMIKDGVVLIDAGTSGDKGKLAGDIDPACKEKALYLSPVPGGVGPLSIEGLFKNLFLPFEN